MTTETELRTRLRETGDALTGPTITFDQIVRRAARRRQQRRLTIAGVTAVVLIGIAGLAAFGGSLLDDTDHNPNRIETVDDGDLNDEDGLPLPESTGPMLEWEQLDTVEDEFRLATWHDDGSQGLFYATITDDMGNGHLVVSADGSDWIELPELPFPLEHDSLVSGGGNLYALENIDEILEDGGERATPLWWSADNAEAWELFGDFPAWVRIHSLGGGALVSSTAFDPASREAQLLLVRVDGSDGVVLAEFTDQIPLDHEFLEGWVTTQGRTVRYSIATHQPSDEFEGEWLVRESPDGIAWVEAEPWQPDDPTVLAGPGGLLSVSADGESFAWSSDDRTWGWGTVESAFGDDAANADFLIGRDLVLALVSHTDGDRRLYRASIPEVEASPAPAEETEPASANGATPQDDAEAIANLTGAETIIQAENLPDEPQELFIWSDGAPIELILQSKPSWVDRNFIYTRLRDGTYQIFNHQGTLVCESTIDGLNTQLHHATSRSDGSIVLGVSEWIPDDVGVFTAKGWAQDCKTGDRVAIEPMYRPAGEVEYEILETVGGRTFVLSGDAEGNVSRIVDESGRDIITDDDYVGTSTFSSSGNTLAYGEHRGSVSPHFTDQVEVRSTLTGELLLSWQAPEGEVACGLHLIEDNILVVVQGPWEATAEGDCPSRRVTAIDIASGAEIGTIETGASEILYIG